MTPPGSPSTPAAAEAGADARAQAHVRVRVGDCHIAIAAVHVERAIAIPPQGLAALPRRQGALAGMIDLEGRPVPVVSLERWLPIQASPAGGALQRVLVLHAGPARIGLRVDEVLGVKPVDPHAIVRVHHDGGEEELFQSVVPASAGAPILSVLEVERLMALCQVWCDDPALATDPAPATAAAPSAARPPDQQALAERHAVFAVGDDLWAVPARAIHTVVPVPRIELNVPPGHFTVAISTLRGRKLPLVDVAAGAARAGAALRPWVAVLESQGQWIGLTADTCRQLADLAEADLAPTPGDPLLKGLALVAGLGTLRVLDIGKLFEAVPEAAVSEVAPAAAPVDGAEGAGGAPTDAQADTDQAGGHFLVFEADALYASPVDQVVGVVDLPQPVIDELVRGRTAVMDWRGTTLKVACMPSLNGRPGAEPPRMAILLQPDPADHATVGIAIAKLCDWLPAHRADVRAMRLGSVGEFRMVTHQRGSASASMVVVDLGQMAYLLG
ncbi:chemotaxis protein CheW [Acidovorax sp. SUPP1855]|uniref:chemotaxis protein CheW n=1 Tax=Acidovorax sp. SUPP1855 TaxID=431774 RepID=UPI0023DE349E|nr:chemotaxis protein CheW [Acidovorax sp. SUPP1855]GKS86033.1 chemotaxis protein CheW [Acidovorax sp. SUPP1855]